MATGRRQALQTVLWWALLTAITATPIDTTPLAYMTPTDPLILSGTTLELNCSLSDQGLQKFSAEDISFRFNNTEVAPEYVTVVDSAVAMLRVPNTTRQHTGHWFCADDNTSLANQYVTVGDMPVMPRIVGCTVYNWERMTCRWEPKVQDTGIQTNQTLYWTLIPEHGWFHCPNPKKPQPGDNFCVWYRDEEQRKDALKISDIPYYVLVMAENGLGHMRSEVVKCETRHIGIVIKLCLVDYGSFGNEGYKASHVNACHFPTPSSCTWPSESDSIGDNMKADVTYQMFVKAENQLGEKMSFIAGVYTGNLTIVKPDKVRDLQVKRNETDRVTLVWEKPKEKPLLFKIRYTWSGHHTWLEMNTTKKRAILRRLHPYRVYNISITSIPTDNGSISGFWSLPSNITVRTDESVPSAAPSVPNGGFRISGSAEKRQVDIFWQSIPPEFWNGVIKNYRLRYRMAHSEPWESKKVPASLNHARIVLKKEQVYDVIIDAATSVGYNQSLARTLTPLVIEKASNMPPKPKKLVVVSSEDLIYVNWTAVTRAVGYTVYWCQGQTQYWTCNDELNWISVDGNVTSRNISLGRNQHRDIILGISAEVESVGSTRVDNDQDKRRKRETSTLVSSGLKWSECIYQIEKPVQRPQDVKLSELQIAESITLEWSHPTCKESTYLDKFIIYYCKVGDCPGDESSISHVETVLVDNELEDFTIHGLEPSVTYRVWMQSSSPFKGLSERTKSLEKTVHNSGFSRGIIATICIAAIVVVFFIIFGLYQSVRAFRTSVKEKMNVKIERPPEVDGQFSQRIKNFEDYETDADYMQNTLLESTTRYPGPRDGDTYPEGMSVSPNGIQERAYLLNGSSSHGRSVNDSISSNDTTLTLLQHPSADSLDEVFDSGRGPSLTSRDESNSSHPRLRTVPEERDGVTGLAGHGGEEAPGYHPQNSGMSQPSIGPGYSKCGMVDDPAPDPAESDQPGDVEKPPSGSGTSSADPRLTTPNDTVYRDALSHTDTNMESARPVLSSPLNHGSEYSVGKVVDTASPSHHRPNQAPNTSTVNSALANGMRQSPTMEPKSVSPQEELPSVHTKDHSHHNLLPPMKSINVMAKNNNNGYVTVNM